MSLLRMSREPTSLPNKENMSYSVEAVRAPSLGKRVSMSCDEPLNDSSMKEFPVLEQCFNRSSATLIVGGMGSGKSSLLLQILTSFWKKVFCFIYVVAPASSLTSIKKSPLRVLPDDQFFDGLTVAARRKCKTLQKIVGHFRRHASSDEGS
jgi:predicted ATP-dependent serine protease